MRDESETEFVETELPDDENESEAEDGFLGEREEPAEAAPAAPEVELLNDVELLKLVEVELLNDVESLKLVEVDSRRRTSNALQLLKNIPRLGEKEFTVENKNQLRSIDSKISDLQQMVISRISSSPSGKR